MPNWDYCTETEIAPDLEPALSIDIPKKEAGVPTFKCGAVLFNKSPRRNRFNGARTNFDGLGRDAKDSNTLYAVVWFAF